METKEYHRIFLEAFPNWDVCTECENVHPRRDFKKCLTCGKELCSSCYRGHQVNPQNCLVKDG
jgi:hypothetical protein